MDVEHEFAVSIRSVIGLSCATGVSALAFYGSGGLDPLWWPIWLAPLPLLWTAARSRRWTVALAAAIARVLGGIPFLLYQSRIGLPAAVRLEALILPAAVFTVAVLSYRRWMLRGAPWLASMTFPCVIVTCEYFGNLIQGTYGNTAYTQIHATPIIQIAALGGLWGVTFIVLLPSAMLAAAAHSPAKTRARLAMTLVIVLAAAVGYGGWRAWKGPSTQPQLRIGMVESDAGDLMPTAESKIMSRMHGYAEQVTNLAKQGAQIVVLPEMTAAVHGSVSAQVDALFQQTAKQSDVDVVLGVLHATDRAEFNEGRFYSPDSGGPTVYRKHHLVPGFESRETPGHRTMTIPHAAGKVGVAICADMDYADPARQYGKAGVGMLLVPAWDFDIDSRWHADMAMMRGIEDGFAIVRSAKRGLLTVSDDRGRFLAEAGTSPSRPFTTLLATVPARGDATLYRRWGDWFAWLNVALLALLLCLGLVDRSPQTAAMHKVALCN